MKGRIKAQKKTGLHRSFCLVTSRIISSAVSVSVIVSIIIPVSVAMAMTVSVSVMVIVVVIVSVARIIVSVLMSARWSVMIVVRCRSVISTAYRRLWIVVMRCRSDNACSEDDTGLSHCSCTE